MTRISPGTINARIERKQNEIFYLLPNDGEAIRWTPLKAKARKKHISPDTLNKHLKGLIKVGHVTKDIGEENGKAGAYYRRVIHDDVRKLWDNVPEEFKDMDRWLEYTKKFRKGEPTNLYLKGILRMYLGIATLQIIDGLSTAALKKDGNEVASYLDSMVRLYLLPIINNIAIITFVLKDADEKVFDELSNRFLDDVKQGQRSLARAIEAQKRSRA